MVGGLEWPRSAAWRGYPKTIAFTAPVEQHEGADKEL